MNKHEINRLQKEIHETKMFLNELTAFMNKEGISDERYEKTLKLFKEEREYLKELEMKLNMAML